jgi:hypothetical protein
MSFPGEINLGRPRVRLISSEEVNHGFSIRAHFACSAQAVRSEISAVC